MPIEKAKKGAPVEEPIEVTEKPAEDMSTAPKDGRVVLLEPGGSPARYIRTRRYVGGMWIPRGKWIDPVTGAPLRFEPTGWRPAKEAL